MPFNRGDFIVHLDPATGGAVQDDDRWEIVEETTVFQSRDVNGEFGHDDQILLIRKVKK